MKITENMIFDSKDVRDVVISEKVDVLDKVKELVFLPNTEFMTTEMVANFYEVKPEVVKQIAKRHKDEFLHDGYETKTLKQLVEFAGDKMSLTKFVSTKARTVALFPRRAVLRVGMLLRDSEVAKQVRTYLLDTEEQSTHRKFIEFCEQFKFNIDIRQTTLTYYYHARSFIKSMGYSGNTTQLLKEFFTPDEKKKFGNAWYISEAGLRRFCTGHKRKKMVHVLAKHLGIETFMSPVEVDIAYCLRVAFPELTVVEKKRIEGSREEIDIYIEELKLAIEVDENGHAGYDQVNERRRQKMFEGKLGCKFLRYNPHKPNFTVGEIIADIRRELNEIPFYFASNSKKSQ